MNDEIAKLLEPERIFVHNLDTDDQKYFLNYEDFDALKRGFLKLMEDRDYYIEMAAAMAGRDSSESLISKRNAELLSAMRGEK